MKLLFNLAEFAHEWRGGAVAIGNFDGVHLGHAEIARRLVEAARPLGAPAVVFTFDPHPVRLLRPTEAPPPLTWTDRKADLLAELGVDLVVAYPTDEELLQLSPAEFFRSIVCRRLGAQAVVEGSNFRFGHDRDGDVSLLAGLCAEANVALTIVEPVPVDGQNVSSSRVRGLVAAGDVDSARRMLTAPYRLRGMVVHGAGRGAKLGFPTANLDAIDTLLPAAGVYAGWGVLGSSRWPAAIHIGPNPTFGDSSRKVEVHLVGWKSPLYGQVLEVDFLSRLRDTLHFASVSELLARLRDDVNAAVRIAAEDD